MRHDRHTRRVVLRRRERALDQRRITVGVNDVVARARVLRLLRKNLLENGAGLQLILVGLVEAVCGREQRQRVEEARLDVVGIALREPLHLAHVGARARAMIELVMIGVEGRERLEVIAFARRRPAQRQRPRDGLASRFQAGRRRRRPDLGPRGHGDAPIGHGAIGLRLGDGGEFFQRLPIPERVQRCERGIEARLNVGAAGDRQAHVAAAAFHEIVGLRVGAAREAERKERGEEGRDEGAGAKRGRASEIDRHDGTPHAVPALHPSRPLQPIRKDLVIRFRRQRLAREAIMAAKEISVKKYVVRLSGEERERLETLIRKGKSPARRVLKARILLKADVSEAGKGWSDNRIIEALETSPSMVYRVRKQLVEEGFEAVLSRKPRAMPAVARIFDGEKEAKLIALACSKPPKGRARWTLRLLENKVVELGIVDRASDSTIGRALKKTLFSPIAASTGSSRRRPTARS